MHVPRPNPTYYIRHPEGGAQGSAFLTSLPVAQMHPKVGKLLNGKNDQKTHLSFNGQSPKLCP